MREAYVDLGSWEELRQLERKRRKMKMILFWIYMLTFFALGFFAGAIVQVGSLPRHLQDAVFRLVG